MFKHMLLILMSILSDSYRARRLLGSFEPQFVYQNVPNIWCTTFQDSSVTETNREKNNYCLCLLWILTSGLL